MVVKHFIKTPILWSYNRSGDNYLYFNSDNGGDGYIYLAETPVAPEAGLYDQFTCESNRYDQLLYDY